MNGDNRRGFTLVEFVLALGLMIIVAGLIVPAVSKVREAAGPHALPEQSETSGPGDPQRS